MSYSQPAVASRFAPRDNPQWHGKLFLVYANSVEERQGVNQQTNQPEPYRVVVADIAIIDLPDPENGTAYTTLLGASIGGKAMVPQLSPYAGKQSAALGRLSKLPAQGSKDGAWVLQNFTPQDAQLAEAFEAQAGDWRGKFQQPTPTPAAAQYPAAAPQAYPAPSAPAPTTAAAPAPWFADPANGPLVQKLAAAGVPFATLDLATAQFTASGLA